MTDDLASVEEAGTAALRSAADLASLARVEAELLGKGGSLARLREAIGRLDPAARRAAGAALNEARSRLGELASARRAELSAEAAAARLAAEALDLTEAWELAAGGIVPWTLERGSLTLPTQTRDQLEDTFVGMGFVVVEGPEVETDWHNFEALNIPKAHPARSGFDTLYLDFGEPESTLLRPHTSPVQIRLMQVQKPPIYVVAPGRCYRKDTPDARRIPSFSQIEGLVVDHGISFADLAGTIEAFTHAYFGPEFSSRLRPGSFPFTEPSAEFEVTCVICAGSGCRTCSNTGWVELGGCGMVHPAVFEAVEIDPEEWTGFAFGFGIDRLAQVRHTIPDARVLLDNDLRFTNQF